MRGYEDRTTSGERPRTLVLLPEGGLSDPASRTRCYALAEKLTAHRNIQVLSPLEHADRVLRFLVNTFSLFALYRVAKQSRNRVTLFVQRGARFRTRVFLLLVWRRVTGSKLVFDFDDAIYIRFPQSTRSLCTEADLVLAANENLAAYARQFSRRVFVVPTSIDLNLYGLPRPPTAKHESLVIGWIGTRWNLGYLAALARPLERLKSSCDFVLALITEPSSASDLELPQEIRVRIIPWTLKDFVQNLATFDVGVCPLPDDPWTRGKSSYKVLEYMALGIPAVASPVGGIVDAIEDGKDGFLATTEDEWYVHLSELLHHPELRSKMGKAGREKVESRYSLDVTAESVERYFSELDRE